MHGKEEGRKHESKKVHKGIGKGIQGCTEAELLRRGSGDRGIERS